MEKEYSFLDLAIAANRRWQGPATHASELYFICLEKGDDNGAFTDDEYIYVTDIVYSELKHYTIKHNHHTFKVPKIAHMDLLIEPHSMRLEADAPYIIRIFPNGSFQIMRHYDMAEEETIINFVTAMEKEMLRIRKENFSDIDDDTLLTTDMSIREWEQDNFGSRLIGVSLT